ncbi:MAG: glycosyltransferase family 4 protein [Blastocatellales bacterium]
MRIGVDATITSNSRGYGRHARSLLDALLREDTRNRYTMITDEPDSVGNLPAEAEVKLVRTDVPTSIAAAAGGRRSLSDMVRMSLALSDPAFDMILFPTVYSYVPVFSTARKIVMIHDVIAEKFPHLTVPTLPARLFWKAKVALGRLQADAIVTVSDYSKRCIAEHFGTRSDKVYVVGEAGDPVFRPIENPTPTALLDGLGLTPDRRLIVYVGGFNPHKNLETLIRAFKEVSATENFSDLRLVMVGEYKKEVFHSYFGSISELVNGQGLTDRVIFTGYLPDEDLAILLNYASALVLPSLMEGFGLPAVEAAASGCPVIATTASPLPDLLGDGGLFVDPCDLPGFINALRLVTGSDELRSRMRKAGIEAAGRLTWSAAAGQMMDVIREVAG